MPPAKPKEPHQIVAARDPRHPDAINPSLQQRLREFRAAGPDGLGKKAFTGAELGKMLNCSGTYVSRYLSPNGKLPYDIPQFEAIIEDVLRSREISFAPSSEVLFQTPIARQFEIGCEHAQKIGFISLITGMAGWGKTSAIKLYVRDHPTALAICLNVRDNTAAGVERLLFSTTTTTRWKNNTSRWSYLVERFRGSGRVIIIDNAHRLTKSGRLWVMDFYDETECPIILVGNPSIVDVMQADAESGDGQQARRLSYYKDVKISEKMIGNVVTELVAQHDLKWSEDEEFIDQCIRIAKGSGHLGTLRIHLRAARLFLTRKPSLHPIDALMVANQQVINNTAL